VGKYDLGKAYRKVSDEVSENELYIDKERADYLVNHIEKQLDIIRASLLNINNVMNQIINSKELPSSRVDVIRGWSRKAKKQGLEAEKIKEILAANYDSALVDSSDKILDEYIKDIKDKLEAMSNE